VAWHGWTFADLIAPSFLWVIGVTTVLSLSRRLENAPSHLSVLKHVLKRALVLYLMPAGKFPAACREKFFSFGP
jgi:predicted acyltransferase